MRGLLEQVKRLLLEKASPRIPFVFYAPELYAVYVDDIEAHKKLSVLALLLERDEDYIEEARELIERGRSQMETDDDGPSIVDGDTIGSALMDFLVATHPNCEECVTQLENDSEELEHFELIQTYAEKMQALNKFKHSLKGRYHVDFDDCFQKYAIDNHYECLVFLDEMLREPLAHGNEFLIVLDVHRQTLAFGRGVQDNAVTAFCYKQCVTTI